MFEKLTINAGLRLQDHKIYGKTWIPAGGFAYNFTKQTTLKASLAKGFRSPTIQELFIWNHNINLSPESIMNYETSLLQSLLNSKIKIELTGFVVKGNNLIINVPMEGLRNAGEIYNKGIEMAVSATPVENLALNLTYSFTDMKKTVYATPRHNLFISSDYRWNKLRAMASVQYINHLDTDPSSAVHFEDYTLVSAKVSYKILKYAEIFASAENLLNQKYETNRYYTMPGTTVFGGVNLKFDR